MQYRYKGEATKDELCSTGTKDIGTKDKPPSNWYTNSTGTDGSAQVAQGKDVPTQSQVHSAIAPQSPHLLPSNDAPLAPQIQYTM